MATKKVSPNRGFDSLLASKEMIVVCGSGGTGKTTIAAALGAVAATRLGARVLVLTVDPARRLATALGLDKPDHDTADHDTHGGGASGAVGRTNSGPGSGLGHSETRVDLDALCAEHDIPASTRGELWMAMLDTKAGWDELIRRHAPDAKLRDQVLANPLYQNITGRFVHSHDYIAMEQLHELHASGRYDLVIIDTPPSRNALDLLDAPGRMKEFFGSRLLRWLTVPYRSRFFTLASKPFYQVADRILGSRFLQDIAEFFVLFQTMEKGFVSRAAEVERLLVDPRTSFVVVSTLEAAPAHEAAYLAEELGRRKMNLGAIVLNRTLPASIRQPAAATSARKLVTAAADPQFLAKVATALGDGAPAPKRGQRATEVAGVEADVQAVLSEVGERFHDIAIVASREAERRSELESIASLCVSVPSLDRDVSDLAGLIELGGHLVGDLPA